MRTCRPRRSGLSLVELLLASAAMAIIATALGTLAATIHASNDYCQQQGQALAHARSAWLHIRDTVEHAHASESFPGCLVVAQTSGADTFPDSLVVWKPATVATDPTGLPRVNELFVYTPNPQTPNELWEISAATNTGVVPVTTDTAGWQTLVTNLKSTYTAQRLVITNRLRTTSTSTNPMTGQPASTGRRTCLRFRVAATPTDTEWAAYRAGTTTFTNLSWPLDLYGKQAGLRNVACFVELQMDPDASHSSTQTTLPFFGAASLRYALKP